MGNVSSFWAATRLVAGREITVRLRDKTFLFSTVFFLLFTLGAAVVPALFAGDGSTVAVAAAPDVAAALDRAGLEVVAATDTQRAEQLVRDGDVDAAVVPGDVPGGVRVLAMKEAPDEVVSALSSSPPVQLLDSDAVNPVAAFLIPFAFGFVFLFASLTFGIQIAQSVTEEKQTRIVEILVAAVPVRALLAGKVLGNGALALGQVALIGLVSVLSMRLVDAGPLLGLIGPAIGWFIPFFVVGFVLLASLWAVAGALVSRQEDISGASTPIQMLVMIPFFAVSFLNDNPVAMTVLSYVPFSAPTAMPLRLFTGDAAGWEPFLSLLVLVVGAVLCLALAARLYEGALLRTNGKTSVRAAWQDREMRVRA
ncbi:ABC transporter permease [Plantactinospora sp. B5E13]|uniref:ABC transporter permease n=1 Tax=unclassified Plantactinospora TaxID=2631981 RepID=UPI00325F9137